MTTENETDNAESNNETGQPEQQADRQAVGPSTDVQAAITEPPDVTKRPKIYTRRTGGKKKATLDQAVARFAACGRCSFFLTGYRAEQGLQALQMAVEEVQSGWLALHWDQSMRNLVHKSYGIRVDVAYDYYESCCTECRRRFIFQAADEEESLASFLIEL